MKALPIAAGIVLLALAVVAGSVFGLGDTEILVSPPEVVAQEFVRAVAHGQGHAVRRMLTRDAERGTTPEEVHRLSRELNARIGHLRHAEGEIAERRRDTILVRTRIEGERGSTRPVLWLVREYGEWSVARANDVIAPDSVSGPSLR